MTTQTAIAATTDEVNSYDAAELNAAISLTDGQSIQVFTDPPLGKNEFVSVSFTPTGSAPYTNLVDGHGRNVIVDENITRGTLTGPGEFGLTKSETAVSVAVLYDI